MNHPHVHSRVCLRARAAFLWLYRMVLLVCFAGFSLLVEANFQCIESDEVHHKHSSFEKGWLSIGTHVFVFFFLAAKPQLSKSCFQADKFVCVSKRKHDQLAASIKQTRAN